MIVLTIADLINSINLFSTVFTPCLIACPSLSGIWACGPHPCPACKDPSLSGISSRRRRSDIPPRLRRGVANENKKSALEQARR